MRGYHDLGGLPGPAIDRSEHVLTLSEKRIHAMVTLLSDPCREVLTVDELRRGIESLGEAEYNRLGYYDRWITSIANILMQKGLLTPAELGHKLAQIEQREANPS
jgi:hypothetical protein